MIKLKSTCLAVILLWPLSVLFAAELKLAGVFTDHTVLQRDKLATADASGKWLVKLDPMPASAEGREVVVESTLNHRRTSLAKSPWRMQRALGGRLLLRLFNLEGLPAVPFRADQSSGDRVANESK